MTYTLTVTYADSVDVTVSAANATVKNADGEEISGSSADQAVVGEDYTFTVTPEDDYQIDSVTYQVGSDNAETLTGSNGTYTIPGNDVTGSITITVTTTGADADVTLSVVDGAVALLSDPTENSNGSLSYTLTVPDATSVSGLSDLIEAAGTADDLTSPILSASVTGTDGEEITLTFTGPNSGKEQTITVTLETAEPDEIVAYDLALYTEALGSLIPVTVTAGAASLEDVASAVKAYIEDTSSGLLSSDDLWGATVTATVDTEGIATWTPPSTAGGSVTVTVSVTLEVSYSGATTVTDTIDNVSVRVTLGS